MARVITLLLITYVHGVAVAGERGMAQPEARVKAMFLYNFAKFTSWPSVASSPLTFCVLGEDRLDRELEPLLQGKAIGDRSLIVRHVAQLSQLGDCKVIYVGRSERNRITQIIRSIQHKSVLVVSEYPDAGSTGAAINFFMERDKMRFAVNLAAAADAGVVLSSSLLRLARITDEKK